MKELINLIISGRLVLRHTKKDKIPYALLDGETICEGTIRKYRVKDFYHFERLYLSIIKS